MNLQDAYYEQKFEVEFLRAKGDAFQTFFERLMGSRRKGTPEATQASDYPQAADRTVAERERPMTDGRHRAVSAVHGASRRNGEDNELPVFFGADRK